MGCGAGVLALSSALERECTGEEGGELGQPHSPGPRCQNLCLAERLGWAAECPPSFDIARFSMRILRPCSGMGASSREKLRSCKDLESLNSPFFLQAIWCLPHTPA